MVVCSAQFTLGESLMGRSVTPALRINESEGGCNVCDSTCQCKVTFIFIHNSSHSAMFHARRASNPPSLNPSKTHPETFPSLAGTLQCDLELQWRYRYEVILFRASNLVRACQHLREAFLLHQTHQVFLDLSSGSVCDRIPLRIKNSPPLRVVFSEDISTYKVGYS